MSKSDEHLTYIALTLLGLGFMFTHSPGSFPALFSLQSLAPQVLKNVQWNLEDFPEVFSKIHLVEGSIHGPLRNIGPSGDNFQVYISAVEAATLAGIASSAGLETGSTGVPSLDGVPPSPVFASAAGPAGGFSSPWVGFGSWSGVAAGSSSRQFEGTPGTSASVMAYEGT